MKKAIQYSLILILSISILTTCKKKEPDPEPIPDPYTYNNELQSSKDISMATLAIADLDMMVAYASEGQSNKTYFETSGVGFDFNNYYVHDFSAKQLVWFFNNSNSTDGKNRSGSLFAAGGSADYYRDYDFFAKLAFNKYQVNDWKIDLFDAAQQGLISNKVSPASYDPLTTNLKWEIKGKFKFTHTRDATRNMIWEGTLVKTLTNTSDPAVFAPSKQKAINWSLAKVSYSGTITGVTSGNVPFNCVLSSSDPVLRDFSCAVTVGPEATRLHPFVGGVVTFTTSNFHPRTINYGPGATCDRSGTVSFKDETHTVDFE